MLQRIETLLRTKCGLLWMDETLEICWDEVLKKVSPKISNRKEALRERRPNGLLQQRVELRKFSYG